MCGVACGLDDGEGGRLFVCTSYVRCWQDLQKAQRSGNIRQSACLLQTHLFSYPAWRLEHKTAMASSEEDDAASPADQLGPTSLGKSEERKEVGSEEVEVPTPTKLCSACGTKSDAVKLCNGCKCVWYCDKNCQNKHRREHKKECKLIEKELDKRREGKMLVVEELDVGPLGKVPPQEECPICMHVFPLHPRLRGYFTCCGKTVCGGCDHHHQMKSEEQVTCAFCRTELPESEEEVLARILKRVELEDPNALYNMALYYKDGEFGLPVDQAKCIDLLRQSADLGCSSAQYKLGDFYLRGDVGLEQDEEEGLRYMERAAEGGHSIARHEVGRAEGRNYTIDAAMRHMRLAASGGYRMSMKFLINHFEVGWLHCGDLAESLQAFYLARAEMKSKERDTYIAYLKETGKYKAEYDL